MKLLNDKVTHHWHFHGASSTVNMVLSDMWAAIAQEFTIVWYSQSNKYYYYYYIYRTSDHRW